MPTRLGKRTGPPRIITGVGAVAAACLVVAIMTLCARIAVGLPDPAAVRLATIVWSVVLLAIAALLYWLVVRVHRVSLSWLGLGQATNLPAIPFNLSELPGTILGLSRRATQLSQAIDGLSTVWT